MSKIICFKILQFFEALSEKIFHDHTGFIDKANFYSIFPSTTYHWIEMIAVPLGIIAMVFGFLYYPMRRKTPCFSYGDIRRVHRIYASN